MKNCPRVECRRVSISMGAIYKAAYGTLSRRDPDFIQLINVKAVQELILWLDHAVNKVYRLSAIMIYILSLLLLLYYRCFE